MTSDTHLELHVTATATIAFAAFAGVLAWGVRGPGDTFLALVFLAGSLGAAVRNFRHLAPPGPADVPPDIPPGSPIPLYTALIVGGVLGFAIYALCVSGLLGGKLFPAIKGTDTPFSSIHDFVTGQGPADNLDAAKALIWSFIAGWNRGTVVDLLDGLVRARRPASEPA